MPTQKKRADQTQVTPQDFSGVLREELGKLRGTNGEDIKDPIAAAHDAELAGLAFSGGGIRSATFNLGVLQALAGLGLLEKFDYLSTVSGGGYIGSWLAAWIRRRTEWHQQKAIEPGSKKIENPLFSQAAAIINQTIYDLTGGKWGTPRSPDVVDTSSKVETDKAPDYSEIGFSDVMAALGRTPGSHRKKAGQAGYDPPPIGHLREFSNYLTPRKGLWSNDTWTLAVAYLRNFLLTVSVLIGALGAVVLFARAAAISYALILTQGSWISDDWVYGMLVVSLSGAGFFAAMDLKRCRVHPSEGSREVDCSKATSIGAVVCTVFASWMGGAVLWRMHEVFFAEGNRLKTIWYFVGTLAIILCLGFAGRLLGKKGAEKREPWRNIERIGAAVGATVVFFLTAWGLCGWFDRWTPVSSWLPSAFWMAVMFAPVLMLTGYNLFAAAFVGLAGRDLEEMEREWMARLLAAVTKWTLLLSLLTIAVISVPLVLDWMHQKAVTYPHGILGLLWAAISAAGAWIGRKGKETGIGVGRTLRRAVVAVAPVVFIVGLMFILIAGLDSLTHLMQFRSEGQWTVWQLSSTGPQVMVRLLLITGLVSLVTLVWSWRVGVNTFSLHALYGNRLIRAYLGASNTGRHAHPFINFDADDNKVRMANLVPQENGYRGPYLLVNAAINLAHASRLVWQQRKAGAFLFSPLYCGYEFPQETAAEGQSPKVEVRGYVPSAEYADGKRSDKGISLGKAMTISGAAASPNMGYRTSPALAFLMTVFNVRLGWWLPNTAVRSGDDQHRHWWRIKRLTPLLDWLGLTSAGHLRKKGPSLGLSHLLLELLGLTSTKRKYIYVSDGGHFENLGLYELVRRRCHHIVAFDAEEDAKMGFGGLGLAIERCRADFGIPIEIDVTQLRPDPKTGRSRWHCAVGRVRYSQIDREGRDGTLIYIKASLTGDEPQDVTAYAAAHAGFPHESTADQWFDELQFESYRTLGQHITDAVLAQTTKVVQRSTAEQAEQRAAKQSTAHTPLRQLTKREENAAFFHQLFAELANQWYAHVEGAEKRVGDHDAVLSGLIETLRTDPLLAFLDWQLYPDLGRTTRKARLDHRPAPWVPISYDELRAGFFFCRRLLQFMQQVYHERELDVHPDAPSHRGWLNLFRRWSLSRMVRYTWSMSAGSYNKRFQTFCDHHLRLEVGDLFWSDPLEVEVQPQADSFSLQPALRQIVAQPPEGTADTPWRRAGRAFGLDFFETLLAQEYLRLYCLTRKKKNNPVPRIFHIFPLRITTEDPAQIDRNAHANITVGFAVVQPEDAASSRKATLLYLRMRPGLRNMGLARQALADLVSGEPRMPAKVVVRRIDATVTTDDHWHRKLYLELHPMKTQSDRRRDTARAINRQIRKVLLPAVVYPAQISAAEEHPAQT